MFSPFSPSLPSSHTPDSCSALSLPSVPIRADCYSGCVPPSQASGFLKKPTVLVYHTFPLACAGASSPRRHATRPGAVADLPHCWQHPWAPAAPPPHRAGGPATARLSQEACLEAKAPSRAGAQPLACHRFPVSPLASLSLCLGFSIAICSLLGGRASPGASLWSSLDAAAPAVPARHSAEQSWGTAWGWVLASCHGHAKPHAAGGVLILHISLRASPQGRRARGLELPGWEGSVRPLVVPLPWLHARMWWPKSQRLNPSQSEQREPGCSPQRSSLGVFLAAGAPAGAAFPCALIHRGMRRGDKGLVGSQRPGKTARPPAGYRPPQLHPLR